MLRSKFHWSRINHDIYMEDYIKLDKDFDCTILSSCVDLVLLANLMTWFNYSPNQNVTFTFLCIIMHSKDIYHHPWIYITKEKKVSVFFSISKKHAFDSSSSLSSIKHPLCLSSVSPCDKVAKDTQLRSKPASALMAYINLVSSCSLLHHWQKRC